MLVGGVVHDQVHDQPQAPTTNPGREFVEIGEGAEGRFYVLIVTDVVPVAVRPQPLAA